MNRIADTIAKWLGSITHFTLFTFLVVAWTWVGIKGLDKDFSAFTLFLSIWAIYMTIFIERSTDRLNALLMEHMKNTEKQTIKDLRTSRRIESKLNRIVKATGFFIEE